MVDRDDDIRLGLKTAAITFGRFDVLAIGVCYAMTLVLMGWVGTMLDYGWPFVAGLVTAAAIACVHLYWIRTRDRAACFRAFRHNNWFGAALFAGVALEYFTT